MMFCALYTNSHASSRFSGLRSRSNSQVVLWASDDVDALKSVVELSAEIFLALSGRDLLHCPPVGGTRTSPTCRPKPAGQFKTTQWELVAAAGGKSTAESRAALASLCEIYWRPLYAYVRRRGYSCHQAEDLTQGFFAKLLESGTLKNANPQMGRFRSFLKGALVHYLGAESTRANALKHGGGRKLISLDAADAERLLRRELMHEDSPERVFDRQWGLTILNLALNELRERFVHEGHEELFSHLQPCLTCADLSIRYRQLALELNLSEGAVKMAIHRMRGRYRQLVRRQIERTVQSPSEINEEVRHLFEALRA